MAPLDSLPSHSANSSGPGVDITRRSVVYFCHLALHVSTRIERVGLMDVWMEIHWLYLVSKYTLSCASPVTREMNSQVHAEVAFHATLANKDFLDILHCVPRCRLRKRAKHQGTRLKAPATGILSLSTRVAVRIQPNRRRHNVYLGLATENFQKVRRLCFLVS